MAIVFPYCEINVFPEQLHILSVLLQQFKHVGLEPFLVEKDFPSFHCIVHTEIET